MTTFSTGCTTYNDACLDLLRTAMKSVVADMKIALDKINALTTVVDAALSPFIAKYINAISFSQRHPAER